MSVYPEEMVFNSIKAPNLGIKKRRCDRIILNKNNKCGCLRDIDFHHKDVIRRFKENKPSESQAEWKRDTCTCDDGPTDAYGEIYFVGASQSLSKYIRVSYQTDMQKMLQLLTSRQYWNLKQPELLISVTGGAKLNLKQRLKETFCKSLVKVATTTNAWITSGGSYNGCMKLVGEAFKENSLSIDPSQKIVVLGIATWCSVAKYESLIKEQGTRANQVVEYEMIKPKKLPFKCELLDPNHSHFILVDDARHDFGGDVEFRASLETELAKKFKLPMVVLVVGGGPRTAQFVSETVKNKTPCVFLESSGEFANLFSFALKRNAKYPNRDFKNDNFKIDPNFFNDLRSKAIKEYPALINTPDKIEEIIKNIETSLHPQYSQYLTVCRPKNGNAEIDVAILRALLKANKKSTNNENEIQAQLRLALKWNRIDIAKKYILTDENQNKDKIGSLDNLMFTAILDDRIEFVKLFLENGFSLKNFLTYRLVLKLYNELPQKSLLYKMLLKESRPVTAKSMSGKPIGTKSEKQRFTFRNIGEVIESLVEMFYQHKFSKLPFSKLTVEQIDHILNDTDEYGKKRPKTIGIHNGLNKETLIDVDEKFSHPEHELFMFSILLGRFEMAKLFCAIGHNSICSSIIATKILKTYAIQFEDEASECTEMAKEFESLAVEILQKSYLANQIRAELTLIRKIPEFDGCTSVQAAVASEDLNLIAHPCFQNVLVRIWYHQIIPETSSFRLALAIAMPPLAPWIVNFREKKDDNQKINDEESPDTLTEAIEEINEETEKILDQLDSKDFFDMNQKTKSNYFTRFIAFINSPLVKFIHFQVFYLLYLILFSYILLCDFYPMYEADPTTSLGLAISIPEIVLIIWTFTFLIDELRQFRINERKVLKAKIINYFSYIWNIIDLSALVLFFIGMILRFIPDDGCYLASRIVLSLDIILWFIRTLYGYAYLKSLGPKVLMIGKMSIQLCYFLLIIVLFMFAFGVSTQSLMYQNQILDKFLLRRIFFPSYFIIGGEHYTRQLIMDSSANQCTESEESVDGLCADETGASFSLAIFVVYLLFLNILLVNLVIAIFNNTYDQIEIEAEKIWKLQRYGLVFEFYYKPLLPPPFVILNYLFSIFKHIVRLIYQRYFSHKQISNKLLKLFTKETTSGFVHEFSKTGEEEQIIRWEDYMTDEFIHLKEKEAKEEVHYKLDQNGRKLDGLLSKFDDIIEDGNEELNEKIESINKTLEEILRKLN